MSAPIGGPLRRQYEAIDRMVRRAQDGRDSKSAVGGELIERGLQFLLLADYCSSWGMALSGGYDAPQVPPQAPADEGA